MEVQLKVPKHIAFIMDGNGRWAKQRLLPRKVGHKEGVKAIQKVIEYCNKIGVEVCSFYAFSTENWARPQDEIDAIFDLVDKFANDELDKYVNKGYRVSIIGDISKLPQKTLNSLKKITDASKDSKGMIINIALNYGSRQEIVMAVNKILQSGIQNIDEQMLNDCLYTCCLPDPDIVVRTSGEKRLSNFMLWQVAYSEFIFIDEYWPDMDEKIMDKIIIEYSKRDRRFGKIKRVNND